jgi:hypothetical protein
MPRTLETMRTRTIAGLLKGKNRADSKKNLSPADCRGTFKFKIEGSLTLLVYEVVLRMRTKVGSLQTNGFGKNVVSHFSRNRRTGGQR